MVMKRGGKKTEDLQMGGYGGKYGGMGGGGAESFGAESFGGSQPPHWSTPAPLQPGTLRRAHSEGTMGSQSQGYGVRSSALNNFSSAQQNFRHPPPLATSFTPRNDSSSSSLPRNHSHSHFPTHASNPTPTSASSSTSNTPTYASNNNSIFNPQQQQPQYNNDFSGSNSQSLQRRNQYGNDFSGGGGVMKRRL